MKYIEYFEKYLIYIVVFFLALFVLPLLPASFILPRELFLTFSLALLLILFSLKIVLKGALTFSGGKFDFAVLLFALSYLVSSIFITPNKMEAFWLPGTAIFVIASAIFYFLINQLNKQDKQKVIYSLFASAVVFSLLAIFSALKLPAKFFFNTLGGAIPAIIFLAAVIPLSAGLVFKQKGLAKKLFLGVASIIVVLGLLVSVKDLRPAKDNNLALLDLNTSWQIAVDTLKTSPLLGVGPGNYLTAFRRFRPLSFNSSDFWNMSFSSPRNFYLAVITEAGLAGTISLLLLLVAVYRFQIKDRSTKAVSLILFLGLAAFFPIASFSVILLFILLALNSGSEDKIFNVNFLAQRTEGSSAFSSRIPSFIVVLPIIALVIAFGYFGTRYTLAEYHFKKAIDAVDRNDAQTTINEMVSAINLNPNVDRYHSSYAQINLVIAQNLAQNSPKDGLTENDKNTISQLIQIAIAEGKAAVTVNLTRSDNWSLLSDIYRSVMAFAQGADAFAIQTLSQAIALDPVNPSLRISLGGIYYALGRYDEAIDTFKLAVLTKPDLANSHYNLAAAYREKGEIEKAITEMNTVLTLVEAGTPDYDLVKSELDSLEKKRPAKEAEGTQNLTPPQAAQPPVIKPPLELPEEATPPDSSTPAPAPAP